MGDTIGKHRASMLYLIVVLIYSLVVKTTAPYEEEEDTIGGLIISVKLIGWSGIRLSYLMKAMKLGAR